MKKFLIALAAITAVMSSVGVVYAHNTNHEDKVSLCHLTHSESNPFVVQSVNANEVQSHEANGDFLYKGPSPSDKSWCADNQPSDVCPNIAGLQASVPAGMELDSDKQCIDLKEPPVTPPVVPPVMPVSNPAPVTPPVDLAPQVPGFSGK